MSYYGKMGSMPRYLRPQGTASLEAVINAFGNLAKVAIIGYLIDHGPATAGDVATALEVGAPAVKRNLYLLADEGVVTTDPPPTEERNGRRVRYTVVIHEVERLYDELGTALRVRN